MYKLILLCLLSLGMCTPPPPPHSFEKKVLVNIETGSKKVFVSYKQEGFTFKKKRQKADCVTFTCNGCEKLDHYLSVVAWRDRVDSDEENDIYTVDGATIPSCKDHVCANSGVEQLVASFRSQLEAEAMAAPSQPFPALYLDVR